MQRRGNRTLKLLYKYQQDFVLSLLTYLITILILNCWSWCLQRHCESPVHRCRWLAINFQDFSATNDGFQVNTVVAPLPFACKFTDLLDIAYQVTKRSNAFQIYAHRRCSQGEWKIPVQNVTIMSNVTYSLAILIVGVFASLALIRFVISMR